MDSIKYQMLLKDLQQNISELIGTIIYMYRFKSLSFWGRSSQKKKKNLIETCFRLIMLRLCLPRRRRSIIVTGWIQIRVRVRIRSKSVCRCRKTYAKRNCALWSPSVNRLLRLGLMGKLIITTCSVNEWMSRCACVCVRVCANT